MRNLAIILLSVILFNCSPQKKAEDAKSAYATLGSIEIFDPSLEEILNKDAKIEILAEGFDWVEGPVWIPQGGYLLFSDIPPNTVYKWKEGDSVSVYLNPSGYTDTIPRTGEVGSNGLMLNAQGQLLLAQHGDRRIAMMDAPLSAPASQFVTVASLYEGKKLNSPNDLAVHSSGDIYFTDPPYGLEKNMNDPLKEIDFQGVYRWSATDSSVSLLTSELTRPNGINFSSDEKKLIVANSDNSAANWTIFDVNEDGSVSNSSLLMDATPRIGKDPGSCDGMDIHSNGIIFATAPGGVWVMNTDGKLLGKINTGERTSNCTFDDTYKTLYITADSYLLRVKLK